MCRDNWYLLFSPALVGRTFPRLPLHRLACLQAAACTYLVDQTVQSWFLSRFCHHIYLHWGRRDASENIPHLTVDSASFKPRGEKRHCKKRQRSVPTSLGTPVFLLFKFVFSLREKKTCLRRKEHTHPGALISLLSSQTTPPTPPPPHPVSRPTHHTSNQPSLKFSRYISSNINTSILNNFTNNPLCVLILIQTTTGTRPPRVNLISLTRATIHIPPLLQPRPRSRAQPAPAFTHISPKVQPLRRTHSTHPLSNHLDICNTTNNHNHSHNHSSSSSSSNRRHSWTRLGVKSLTSRPRLRPTLPRTRSKVTCINRRSRTHNLRTASTSSNLRHKTTLSLRSNQRSQRT